MMTFCYDTDNGEQRNSYKEDKIKMWSPWIPSGPQLQLQVLDCLPPDFHVIEKWTSDLGSIL